MVDTEPMFMKAHNELGRVDLVVATFGKGGTHIVEDLGHKD